MDAAQNDTEAFERRVYERTHRLLSQIDDVRPGDEGAAVERMGSTSVIECPDGRFVVRDRAAGMAPRVPSMDGYVVLWRNPRNLWLYAVPHGMKLGQQPSDCGEKYRGDWVPVPELCSLGFAELHADEQHAVRSFWALVERLGIVPQHPNEWVNLHDPDGALRKSGAYGSCH